MSSVKASDIPSKTKAQSLSQKRRNRRKKAQNNCSADDTISTNVEAESQPKRKVLHLNEEVSVDQPVYYGPCNCPDCSIVKIDIGTMTNDPVESREKVKATREAKKLAKQQAKMKRDAGLDIKPPAKAQTGAKKEDCTSEPEVNKDTIMEQVKEVKSKTENTPKEVKSKDEVDRAAILDKEIALGSEQDKEQIKAERAAKKANKQAKKKETASGDVPATLLAAVKADTEMSVRDVIQTLRDIKMVALDIKAVTAEVQALSSVKMEPEKKTTSKDKPEGAQITDTKPKTSFTKETEVSTPKDSEEGKSKAQLKAERRAKQEAQRAAKEAAAQAKVTVAKPNEQKHKDAQPSKEDAKTAVIKEKSPKPKTPGKQSTKQAHRVKWFRHSYNNDKTKLDKLPINSNLHPAIIKLGVQLASRVVSGSNARCVALLDALKKMVRDYSLPARTEFGRGLEAHLAASLAFLWSMRQATASQTNAINFFRHRLTQLPNNVDEFDAKKTLQEEIDRYIREQIDMAAEAISITVRTKICKDDVILTYGCSSLIERILVEAHESSGSGAGVPFRVVVAGGGTAAGPARDMTRRLSARRVPCVCVDILALGYIMRTVDKVLVGASALLANGSVLGAAGTGAVALAARAANVPLLVACETHKFSDRVQTDAFLYNEIGDPDLLIDESDENSPLKDWRSNPNLTPLNLTYDVTPPHLVTAVVTELAILPCTSAPVVLRFKLSEYAV